MIIESIFNGIYNVFNVLLAFHIPHFDWLDSITDFIDLLVESGLSIYTYFMPTFSNGVIILMVAVELAVDLYLAVMWALEKIPMANIH